MKDLVFVTYVFGTYTKYIPFYIYGITQSYPEASILILLDGHLNDNEKKAVAMIDNHNVSIIEQFLKEENITPTTNQQRKSLRWLIPYDVIKDFKYAYIGDVDMLIVKEEPSLLDFHINHSKKIERPFSNAIRKNQKRLTGLHFIEVDPYYSYLNNLISECVDNNHKFQQEFRTCKRNEHFLYNIVEQTMGFGEHKSEYTHHFTPKTRGLCDFAPHHGLHIGLLRDKKNLNKIEVIPTYLNDKSIQNLTKFVSLPELTNFVQARIDP